MIAITDNYDLNLSSVISLTATGNQVSNMALTQTTPLPLELIGFVYSDTIGANHLLEL